MIESVILILALSIAVYSMALANKYRKQAIRVRLEMEAQERKADFVNMGSHEVKNLAYEISCHADSIRRTLQRHEFKEEDAVVASFLMTDSDNLKTATSALHNFVFEMLEVSKLKDVDSLPIVVSPVNISNAAKDTLKIFKRKISEKQLLVRFVTEPKELDRKVLVMTDAIRVKQILLNLVGNALKYTDEGSVTITYSHPDANSFRMEIQDTGIGIPAKSLSSVVKGARAPNSEGKPGHGVGLISVSRMVSSMDGGMEIQSKEGHGTIVTVTLKNEAP